MISDEHVSANQRGRARTLGIFWLIYGAFRLIAVLWLVSFSNTATLMFGALLNRVADPFAMMNDFHVLYTLMIVLSIVCGILGILTGLALLAGHKPARALGITVALLSLSDIPLGLALGVYSLVILIPAGSTQPSSAISREKTSDLRSHSSAA